MQATFRSRHAPLSSEQTRASGVRSEFCGFRGGSGWFGDGGGIGRGRGFGCRGEVACRCGQAYPWCREQRSEEGCHGDEGKGMSCMISWNVRAEWAYSILQRAVIWFRWFSLHSNTEARLKAEVESYAILHPRITPFSHTYTAPYTHHTTRRYDPHP